MRKRFLSIIALLLLVSCLFTACNLGTASNTEGDLGKTSVSESAPDSSSGSGSNDFSKSQTENGPSESQSSSEFSLSSVPKFTDKPYVVINNNVPYFTDEDMDLAPFEYYSPLDSLGRCGVTYSCISKELMPTEERGSIGQVKPSGWHTVKYDNVDGKYLYNRCHLIGFQLTAENANEQNLITGTRYMNVVGMLPFENMVADYIKETNNKVLYRVTPIFDGNNLVANGVLMEAKSVEDNGDGILFNVYVYNNQPGITIDYATGESHLSSDSGETPSPSSSFILNKNSKKFHLPSCSSVSSISEGNKGEYTGSREDLVAQGYSACKVCNP